MAQSYPNTPVLSKVKINEQTYWVKDSDVRAILDTFGNIVTYNVATGNLDVNESIPTAGAIKTYLEAQIAGLTGAMHFAGIIKREEEESDLDAINRVITDPKSGDVVVMSDTTVEYIYDGENWREIGSEGLYLTQSGAAALYVPKSFTIAGVDMQDNIAAGELRTALELKALALKDSASATLNDYATGVNGATYTPAGTVAVTLSQTSTEVASSGSFTPAGTVSGNVTAAGTVAIAADNENGFQVTGTVAAPTITVTPETTAIRSVTSAGTLPSYTPAFYTPPSVSEATSKFATAGITAAMDVSDTEMLVIGAAPTGTALTSTGFNAGSFTDGQFNAGALPSLAEPTNVMTGASATADAPAFTGGKIAATFTGTQAAINATFAGTEGDISVTGNYDKAGVQTATFTGSEATITPTLATGSKQITVQ